jgi:hypothetical protein
MARFPRTEADIAALALVVREGLARAPEDFPTPPVAPEELQTRLDAYHAAMSAIAAAEGLTRERRVVKNDALKALVDAVKANLRYAEIAVRKEPEKLARVGWGLPRAPREVEKPGEVRDATIVRHGPGWILLDWKAPVDGGPVAAYTVRRRRSGETAWQDIATSVESELMIQEQERGVELELCVVAVNKAGIGEPSATVAVTL